MALERHGQEVVKDVSPRCVYMCETIFGVSIVIVEALR